MVTELAARLETVTSWQAASLKDVINDLARDLDIGFGKIGQPLRVAITGTSASPDIADTLELIGKSRSLARIAAAIVYMEERAASA